MSIDVEHLSFSYGRCEVLHDLTFSIPDNTLVNVLGPNGVGKSTLFRCILCLNRNWEGGITVNGKDLRALSIRDRASEIAYIPQSHAPVYNYEAVSYTHLDVYKRQRLTCMPSSRNGTIAFMTDVPPEALTKTRVTPTAAETLFPLL